MVEAIEPLYWQIAESMMEKIPEPWHRAWMDAIFYVDQIFYSGEYIQKEGEVPKSFATDRSVRRAFEEIREKFSEAKPAIVVSRPI